MTIQWSDRAIADLRRLHAFLSKHSEPAADRAFEDLLQAPQQLLTTPRMGERVLLSMDIERRRLLVGAYEMRYELRGQAIRILRIYHGREDR